MRLLSLFALVIITASTALAAGRGPAGGQEPDLLYLSLGDSVLAGCCQDVSRGASVLFRDFLEERHGEPVELVNLATNSITSDDFVDRTQQWPGSGRDGTQLDEAVAVLEDARAEGKTVLAIALLIGGNDFIFLRDPETDEPCRFNPTAACVEAFAGALSNLGANLDTILEALSAAKAPETPIFMPDYYNPYEPEESDLVDAAVGSINGVIAGAAGEHGAVLVELFPLFTGRVEELVQAVDPTIEGHAVIADALAQAYEAFPQPPTPKETPVPPSPAPIAMPTAVDLPDTGAGADDSTAQALLVAGTLTAAGAALVITGRSVRR